MFAVLMLKRSLPIQQWVALVVLVLGIVLVQLTSSKDNTSHTNIEQNKLIGFSAALTACVLSGFAGIYFEMILKGSDISVWMRNVQLSFLSLPFGLITCFLKDWDKIFTNGFFYRYDYFVAFVIFLQAGGGLIVALVVKYADNILKGFATSLAIILSSIASIYLFDYVITFQFIVGASLVISSIFLYNVKPQKKMKIPRESVDLTDIQKV